MPPDCLGSNDAVNVAERGGWFSTVTPLTPCHVQTRSSAPSEAGSDTSFVFLPRSCMQGSVAFVFGKFIQPTRRFVERLGSSPNANSPESKET